MTTPPGLTAASGLCRFQTWSVGVRYPRQAGQLFLVQFDLPFALRPVFTLGHFVSAAVQEVDLVKSLPVAHLHDFAAEIPHGCCGAAVFAPGAGVCRSVHVRQERNFLYPHAKKFRPHLLLQSAGGKMAGSGARQQKSSKSFSRLTAFDDCRWMAGIHF